MLELTDIKFSIEEQTDIPGLHLVYILTNKGNNKQLIGICRKDRDKYLVDLKKEQELKDYEMKAMRRENSTDALLSALAINLEAHELPSIKITEQGYQIAPGTKNLYCHCEECPGKFYHYENVFSVSEDVFDNISSLHCPYCGEELESLE